MTSRFPLPLCALCGRQPRCLDRGFPEADYPSCQEPLRNVRLDRTRELLARCAPSRGFDLAERELLARLLPRYATDRGRYSDILEPSISLGPSGLETFRFSYAFPGWRRDPPSVAGALLGLCEPFGAAVVEAARRALRAARHPAVEQVIFGYAGSEDVRRVKLYLQFLPSRDDAARVVTALTGLRVASPSGLHLLGLDMSDRGLSAVKVYFARTDLDRYAAALGGVDVGGPLRCALFITRGHGPGAVLAAPSEVDFSLAENDMTFDDLCASPAMEPYGLARGWVEGLARDFYVGVRRVSLGLPPTRKINVYYTLTEVDGAARDRLTPFDVRR